MSNVVVDADTALIESETTPGFSWAAVLAGAFVASATIFFLLSLGAGIGLSLFSVPQNTAPSVHAGLTLGAIYFFAAQAFGLAVGGYVAGRLMGPVLESREEEIFHASAHGLTTWALAVTLTGVLAMLTGAAVTGAGAGTAAILGVGAATQTKTASATDMNGYWVDTLFRPSAQAAPSQTPAPAQTPAGQTTTAPDNAAQTPAPNPMPNSMMIDPQARAEATRILAVGAINGQNLSQPDHDRLAAIIAQTTGAAPNEASQRVDEIQTRMHQEEAAAEETARRFARFASLWLAASLIFGALVASGAAVTGRWIDDEERGVR